MKSVPLTKLNKENVDDILGNAQGIIVPGGFGNRGVEGMITAANYARTRNIPYLGLCLGMQVAIIEFSRNVCGMHDAHSIELDPNTTHPVISLMPDQDGVEDIGGDFAPWLLPLCTGHFFQSICSVQRGNHTRTAQAQV